MKRFIIPLIMLALICIQNSLFEFIRILGVKPDIVLTFIICFSLVRGNPECTIVGIFGGILEDIFFGYAFGVNTVACMITAYLVGLVEGKLYKDNIFIPAIFVFGGTFVKELIVYFLLYLTRSNINIMFALNNIILREAIYNILFAGIFFKYIAKMCKNYLPDQSWRY